MTPTSSTRFTVMVSKSPFDSRNAQNALRFCHAALAQGHSILQVFFYQTGVHNASALLMPNADELNIYKMWCDLSKQYNIDLNVCVSAASRRGVVDSQIASTPAAANLKPPFTQVGLSAYFEAIKNSVSIQL
jgi:tRNA 2-thiouridine synthesizing protein D